MTQLLNTSLKILIVDDDELDRMSVRRAMKAADPTIVITEAENAAAALKILGEASFDCAILDYRLPGVDGLGLLKQIRLVDKRLPVIMMTGQSDERLIVDIMKAGATDYLSKSIIQTENLMAGIRNAIRVQQAEQQLEERTQQAMLGAEVGVILTSTDSLPKKLQRCTETMVRYFDAALARIWTLNDATDTLELQASAGIYTHLDDEQSRVPVGKLKIGLIAKDRQPQLTNDVSSDPLIDQAWAASQKICSFAGYPLIAQDTVIGVMAMFARRPLSDSVFESFSSISDEIALAIQQARSAEENERLYLQAQEAIQIREVFLSVASHELKTPLTSLTANIQLLIHRTTRENSLNERDHHTLNIISEQALRLNKLIGTLLDISRLENGKLSIQPEPLDLRVLVKRLVEETLLNLESHKIELEDAAEPLPLLGDELRLEQALQNLIQNAIKYSPKGGVIKIKLSAEAGVAVMAIIDQGIGIPQEAILHLFDRFFRAPNAHERNISGMGLGLYVVKEIIGLHDGTIEVTAEEGIGSTFTVKLPLYKQTQKA